ncbi:MAG: hypothetical protein NVV62_15755 [Terricaulis sp.]|nr:hypothetical protein [Terricaulis sp.]
MKALAESGALCCFADKNDKNRSRPLSKNHVFEALFAKRYDATSKTLSEPMVTLQAVSDAIAQTNAAGLTELSTRNPANFIKDYLRSAARNKNWPDSIRDAGYTARQRTGEGRCFEFVPLAEGEDPFPDDFQPQPGQSSFVLETLSLPLATREIVREDEQSLAQLSARLHLIEHFLASSSHAVGWGVREVVHLQNNVKLAAVEIDALYQATRMQDGKLETGAIAVEVKIGDPIIAEQIANQTLAILKDEAFAFCIPVVVKRFAKGSVVALHTALRERSDVVVDEHGDISVELGGVQYSAEYVFSPALKRL